MKKHTYILLGITTLLLFLWVPTTLHKFIDFESFRNDIYRQPFGPFLSNAIIYSLPFLETLTVLLLVLPKYRVWGFISSTFLMSIFTLYIATALLNVWDKLPCGCGLMISKLNWQEHLWFNLIFLILSITAWCLQHYLNTKRRSLKSWSSIYN